MGEVISDFLVEASMKTQTCPPIEGMNCSHCITALRKGFSKGSARASVCGHTEPAICLFGEDKFAQLGAVREKKSGLQIALNSQGEI